MFKKLKAISSMHKSGNTLSETLIATVVIGIVFTLSFGIFVANYNKDQTVVRLKKVYSVLTQAFMTSISENGDVTVWEFPDKVTEQGSYIFFNDYLKKHLILSRDCKNSTQGVCSFTFKDLQAKDKQLSSTWARFYLNDGTFIAMQCNGNDKYKVIYFYADTNGKKRLNVVARDIFLFEYWIQNDDNPDYVGKLLPFGHQYTRDELISDSLPDNCNKTKNGNYCSSLIIKDNWQILKGYPWAQARYVVQ